MRTFLFLLFNILLSTSVSAQTWLEAYDFCYTRGRTIGQQITNTLSTNEFRYALTAVCAAYGADCSSQASSIQRGAKRLHAEITVPKGDESNGIIRVPMDVEVCRAAIDMGNASITGRTHFNTTIMRSGADNGLGFTVYAQTRGGVGSPREWVNARLWLQLVPAGQRNRYNCPPLPSRAWDCAGRNCRFYQAGSVNIPTGTHLWNGCR